MGLRPVQSLSACTRVNFTFFYYMLREVRLDIIITTHTRIKWNLRPTSYFGGLSFKSRPWGGLSLFIFRVFLCPSWQIQHQYLEWDHYGFVRHLFTVALLILTECFIFWVALRGMNVRSAHRIMSRRSRIAIIWHLCAPASCFKQHEGEGITARRTEVSTVPATESSRFREYICLCSVSILYFSYYLMPLPIFI